MLKKNVAKISLILLLILVILFYSASFVLARDNYAIGIATVDDEGGFLWDTKNSISQVIGAYSRAGYRVYGVANPGKQHLWEQLYADVQCFLCHGNKDCVVTAISGIVAGSDRTYAGRECIGTDSVHWDADTILVIYGSCKAMGDNGVVDQNSVGFKTAVRGAQVVVGWTSEIGVSSVENWTINFNNRLADGYTLQQAMDYANSFTYRDSRANENSLGIHHSCPDMKIGKYRNFIQDEVRPEDNLLLKSTQKSRNNEAVTELNQVYNIIRETYPQFNENNYEISSGDAILLDINTNQEINTNYVNLKLKLGEFETNSGFTIKLNDGIVEAIYDNTIDFNTESNLVKTKMTTNYGEYNSVELKNDAVQKVLSAYKNNVSIDSSKDVTSGYFYDIETGKKYLEFYIRSTMGDTNEECAEAYDTIRYEI